MAKKINPLPPQPIPSEKPMTPKELKSLLDEAFESATADGVLTEEQKNELRGKIVDEANKLINIPIIGEAVERAILMFAFKFIERLVVTFFKKKVLA